jgi:hypothetical protein
MVIKPIGQSGASTGPDGVGEVGGATGAEAAGAASGVGASTEAALRAALQSTVDRVASQVKTGEIAFSTGLSEVISSMARQQMPSGLKGPALDARLAEAEQVFADDPRVAASVERLLRGAIAED